MSHEILTPLNCIIGLFDLIQGDKEKYITKALDDYLNKPIKKEEL